MIFTPFKSEQENINRIQQIRSDEYSLLRLTSTMIDKNNIDANGFFRNILNSASIVDYENLEFGSQYKVVHEAIFIQKDEIETTKFNFYRVTNKRGDRRFSIETLKQKVKCGKLNEGDLLYFGIFKHEDEKLIYMINLTSNVPNNEQIIKGIGLDEITSKLQEIKPRLRDIINGGWFDNIKGKGKKSPKDVGDTLESLLSVETNNRQDADIDGLIEIKAKSSKTLDTLFTLRPNFENTEISKYEPKDRNRVSAFARLYGYESGKHPNAKSLYITIGSKTSPQNNQGFYLEVDEENEVINLMKKSDNKDKVTAFWKFSDLKSQLESKHPSTLWVTAKEKDENGIIKFKYTDIEFTRKPQFMTFLSLIKSGVITYDWRGYTSPSGNYVGKNHGNAWRIKPKQRNQLFSSVSVLDFNPEQ